MSIQAGRYTGRAKPETLIFGYAKNGGEQVAMNIEIISEGFEGQSVGWYGSFAGKAAPITLRQLRDAGWTGDSLTDASGLGSVDVDLDVRFEEYEGKDRMKVAIYPVGGFVVKMDRPIAGKDLAAFDARMRGAILQSKRPAANGARSAAPGWSAPSQRPAPAAGEWDGTGADPNPNDDGR